MGIWNFVLPIRNSELIMAMTLVSTVTVGSGGAASIEFTGIAGTGKDLLVVMSGRSDAAANSDIVMANFNGDTASNYTTRYLRGDGSTVASGTSSTTFLWFGSIPATNYTASTFGNAALYVSNYASSAAKSVSVDAVPENNAIANAHLYIIAATWTGTSAITSIKIDPNSGSFAQHSTASLYLVS